MLTVCHNPFRPDKDQQKVALLPAECVGEALQREGLDGRYVVSCNGEILPPERALSFVPRQGDDVQAVPQLANSTVKMIGMLGVAAAAAFFTAGLGSFIGGTLITSLTTAAQNAIAATIISVGGSLLVNGIASLFQKQPGGANYGVLGPSTTARSGIPIPKGYGEIRAGGNIVESWIDIQGNNGDQHDTDDGADTIGRQYINCRVDFGFGPARSITDLQINGKDISNFSDVCYCLLYGTNDQAPVTASDSRWVQLNLTETGTTTNTQPTTDFNTVNNNYPTAQRVRAGTGQPVVVPGQRDDTEKITVFVNFPQGVWRYDDNMEIKRAAVDYDVYYRPAGSGDAGWIHVPGTSNDYTASTHYYYNIRQTLLRQATIIDGLSPGRYDIKVVKNGAGAVHNPIDEYEHEDNMWGDELWIESVQEASYTTLAYPNFIQVCLRIMASDQISGADISLSAVIEYGLRSTLPEELAGLPENTPAAVAYDIMADDVIGADMPDSRIDLDFLAGYAALTRTQVDNGDGSTQPLAVFNGVFDQDGVSIWDALGSIGVMSRANFQRVGTKVTGWLDQPDDPVQMFHVGNILADSYSKTYLNLEDRAQEIEVTFADAADDYKTRNPCRVVLAQDETSEEALKKTRVNLLGCTDRAQAYYWATHKLFESETLLRTHTWQSNTQAIRCKAGNIALLQHDVPEWGYGGNLQPGSTASQLVLDRDGIPFDTSGSYTAVVNHPALQRMGVTITSISGNVLQVVGYDGTTPVRRLVQGTVDVAIVKATASSIKVEDATGIAAGAAVLWDLDVMETRTVSSLQGNVATLATPLSAVPVDFAGFIYQSVSKQAKLVRIKLMKKKIGDQKYTLTAVDYSPATYDIPAPVGLGA